MRLAVFTTCSNSHVPQAQALLTTVARFLPDADRFLVLADACHPAVSYPTGCEVIGAEALGIPDFAGLAFRYDAMEFAAAVKPFAFLHLLGARCYSHCLYFDPDVELFSPLPAIMDALAANAPFVLTPHILAPAEREGGPDDVTVMRAGVFNLGFLGVSGVKRALDILGWWSRWLRWSCVDDRSIGLFVDQKFMDLAPGLAPGVRILHDPGLNVGYWNLSQRRFAPDAPGGALVDGGVLGFFHYGGFDPARPDRLSAATDWFGGAALPTAWRQFLAGYADRLLAAGQGAIPQACYAYGRFASGVPIPAMARRMFRDDYDAWAGDPFKTFEIWAHLPALGAAVSFGSAIPSLMMQWLQARTPALAGLSLGQTGDAQQITRWWLEHGPSLGVDRRFLAPQALAAGLRPAVVRASRRLLDCDGVELSMVAPFGEDSPAGHVGRAQRASLPFVADRVEALDSIAGASATGRVIGLCAPLDELACLLDDLELPGSAYRILIPAAERIAPWPPGTTGVHEIWAPTRFIQAALALASELPVLYMPVAWQFPAPAARDQGIPVAVGRPYILVACDAFAGSDELLAAVRAYAAAFGAWPAADRPTLVLPSHSVGQWDDALRTAVAGRGIAIADSASLAAGAACLLSLHRGEALGIAAVQAMASGVPVVATDYGGCTDLLTPETGFAVDYRLGPARAEAGSWAEADACHAAWSLREVFTRPDEARRRAANARHAFVTHHDPAVVGAQQAMRLRTLDRDRFW